MNNKNIKHENVKKSFSLIQKRKHELNKIKLYIVLTLSITLIFVIFWILAMIPSVYSGRLKVYQYYLYPEFTEPKYNNITPLFIHNDKFLFYSGTLGAIAFYSIALILACLPFYAFAYFFLYKKLYVRKLQEFDKANTKWKEVLSSQQ
ncbi:hypothetical protein ACM0LK_01170 [Mycoplasma sp. Z331B]|uniref:hypothetical protein n=1 Tax=Mycoplasma sp. Z331B TaxID=3398775 RepID=UPI003A85FC55